MATHSNNRQKRVIAAYKDAPPGDPRVDELKGELEALKKEREEERASRTAEEQERVERERDEWELALIRAALDAHLPMLCVCRGAQLLNVALGGTLIQHLDQADRHARWDLPRIERCHTVRVTPGSRADSLYGTATLTNSLHHQAVGRRGEGVLVTGVSDDGVVEAFEVEGRPEVFAVQWHPEMLSDQIDPAFTWLITTAHTSIGREVPTSGT